MDHSQHTISELLHRYQLPTYENRSLLKRGLARYRMLTHDRRALPDFMIIGTQKGGTTSLYRYLAKHPQLKPNYVVKELSFFDEYYNRGIDWYRSNFPIKRDGKLYFEGCTHYLYHPSAPKRILETIPAVKTIALLRNPIDRAYSSYRHQVRAGRETLSFEDALQAEPERLQGERERLLSDPAYVSYNYNHFSYIERGKYDEQIKNWFIHFPKGQMLILSSEAFFDNPGKVIEQCLNFLEVPITSIDHNKKHNTGNYNSPLEPATREQLQQLFLPHNQALYQMLDTDFGWK